MDYPSQGSEMDADEHPSNSHNFMKMAGDVVPLSPNNANTWQNAGPSATNDREQALKIFNAPSTGNIYSPVTKKVLK